MSGKPRARTEGHALSDKKYFQRLKKIGIKGVSFRLYEEEIELMDEIVKKQSEQGVTPLSVNQKHFMAQEPNRLSLIRELILDKAEKEGLDTSSVREIYEIKD